ncbi:TPA: hypothetical protein U8203_000228 [Pseudomonas putida]|nr:hypothetical protein [Pseudomonas putida]HEN8714959.1 hypothetical protein [Pseudomonas putida]
MSDKQMVSVPPYIGLEPLAGRYYPAQCRRCGWVGSSEELTEDDAQCTRDVGGRLCLGDCDELERHDLLSIIQAMAEQHQVAPELTDDLREILGRPNFTCHFIAKALRVMGHSIAHKSEDEQAVVIHWLLGIYLKHGSDWRQRASAELEEASKALKY